MSLPLAAPTPDPAPAPTPAPAKTSATTTLARLAPGRRAVVAEVDAASPIGRRLLDLGFRPGTALRVVRRAPLGDPTLYELRGTRLCLRRSEAERIRVTAVEPSPLPDAVGAR